jgi:large repetitive protein
LINNVMPPGLILSPSGLISGTPTSTGAYSFTIQLTSGGVTRRVGLTLTINATSDDRFLTLNFGPMLGDLATGRGVSFTLTPTNGAGIHAWSIVGGSLPTGLALLTDNNLPPGFSPPTAVMPVCQQLRELIRLAFA